MIRFTFPPPAKLMSLNDRMHWRPKNELTQAWRMAAYVAAVNACRAGWSRRRQPASTVTVFLPVADRRRRDPHNFVATVKPIIDGLVDAGLWPDDTPEWVATTEPRLWPGATLVEVTITARGTL